MSLNQSKITAISPQTPYEEHSCLLSDVLARVAKGEIIVIRNSAFMGSQLDQFNQIALNQIKTLISHQVADQIHSQGWSKLHQMLEVGQLHQVNLQITEATQSFLLAWGKQFVSDFLDYSDPFYLYTNAIFRTFIPYEIFAQHKRKLYQHLRSLRFTSPHRDSWVEYALTAINLWISVDRVSLGNSLLFYPQQWEKKILPPASLRCVDRDYPVGKPLRLALQPGDALLFSGEHLHSSELNTTDETRCALTMRFSLTLPQGTYFNQWRSWYDSRWVSHRWKLLAMWRSFFSYAHLGYRLKNQQKRWHSFKNRFLPAKTSAGVSKLPQPPLNTNLTLQPATIQVKDAHTCIVRTENGVVEFPRYCPHEGADLAQGYIEDGKLYCPWHSLAFELKTGAYNCSAFRPLPLTKI